MPSDSIDYTSATATTSIDVSKVVPKVVVSVGGGTYDGTPFAAAAAVAGIGGSGPSLEGASPTLTYYTGDSATGTPRNGPPTAAGTYTVVAAFPGSSDYAGALSTPATFTITPAAAIVTLESSSGSTAFGQPVTLTASVSLDGPGAGTPTGVVTFYDGKTALAGIPLDLSGRATMTIGSLSLGGHSITAVYGGDVDFLGGRSGAVSESVSPADTQIIFRPDAVFKGNQIASLRLTAEVEPLVPDGGLPTGTISFTAKKKRLGTVALTGGKATLAAKAGNVLKKPLTIVYDGGAGYRSSTFTLPRLTKSLVLLARASPKPVARPAEPTRTHGHPAERSHLAIRPTDHPAAP